jgi:hypothetical protein
VAKLSSKVQNALDEARILVLGAQVVIGFELRAVFEEGFADLPRWAQTSKVVALAAMLATLALIVAPSPFHRIAERGEDSERLHAFARGAIGCALLPFAVAIGLDVLVAGERIVGARVAAWLAAAAAATALAFWYGLGAGVRAVRGAPREETEMEPTSVDKKIRHVLTETRMVLPGAQALLAFQLAVTLTSPFRELPWAAQVVHLATVLLTALVIVLLVTPAAWHRIVERGEETEGFHRVATRFVLAAIAPLSLSLGGGFGIVVLKVFESPRAAIAAGAATTLLLLATWYGLPLAARARRGEGRRARRAAAHA